MASAPRVRESMSSVASLNDARIPVSLATGAKKSAVTARTASAARSAGTRAVTETLSG